MLRVTWINVKSTGWETPIVSLPGWTRWARPRSVRFLQRWIEFLIRNVLSWRLLTAVLFVRLTADRSIQECLRFRVLVSERGFRWRRGCAIYLAFSCWNIQSTHTRWTWSQTKQNKPHRRERELSREKHRDGVEPACHMYKYAQNEDVSQSNAQRKKRHTRGWETDSQGNPLLVSLKRILWTGLKTNECIDSSERDEEEEEENEIFEQRTRSFVRRKINRKRNVAHSFDVCLANGKSGELEDERSPPRSNFGSIRMSMLDNVVYIDGRAAFLGKVRLSMFMLNATSRESWASSISKRRSACGSKSFERISKKSLISLALNSLICGNWRRSVKWRM